MSEVNPLTYCVDALRYTMIHQSHFGLAKDLVVITIMLVVCVAFAVNRFNRIQA
jgi:ABC-type multidrug transport system permease subunit